MLSDQRRWRVGGVVALSRHWRRHAGVRRGGNQQSTQGGRWNGGGRRGKGNAQHEKQHNKEPGNIKLGQKMSKQPKYLYVLWREFNVGLQGGKAVRDFTSRERGANRYAYSHCKYFWDAVAGLLQMGYTAHLAVDRVYKTYGKRLSVTIIIDTIIVDKQAGTYKFKCIRT
jgi:hypothetical protein